MKIKTSELFKSAAKPSQFPQLELPEIAFAGRSNVGKSSLANSLLLRKKLFKTSATPGKTQLINFFLINQSFCFVDLPGYGFAKVPKVVRAKWRILIETYLSQRQNLKGVVLIIDIRHGPTPQDQQLLNWLVHHQRPVLVVVSKADKLSRGKQAQQLQSIHKELQLEQLPLPHSILKREGRAEIWKGLTPWLTEEQSGFPANTA